MPYPKRTAMDLQKMYIELRKMRGKVEHPEILEMIIHDHMVRMLEVGCSTPAVREYFGISNDMYYSENRAAVLRELGIVD
jgi:hypothetical protein